MPLRQVSTAQTVSMERLIKAYHYSKSFDTSKFKKRKGDDIERKADYQQGSTRERWSST